MKKKSMKRLNLQFRAIAKINDSKIKGGRPTGTNTTDTCFCQDPSLCNAGC